ncbi:GNAT family N-acetyltransferase, partial [Rhizobium phaseoli]
MDNDLRFEPVTAERWGDFETLFGPQGAFYNCWCVALRLPHAVRMKMAADERKAHMQGRIEAGPPPGILCYAGGEPV